MDVSLSENGEIMGDEATEVHSTLPKTKKIEDILDEKHTNESPSMDVAIVRADVKKKKLAAVISAGVDEGHDTGENVSAEGNQISGNVVPCWDSTVSGSEGREADVSASVVEEEEVGDKDEEMDVQNHRFSVGDFVWGKIKSHPWWPGQIYNPSDASGYAGKHRRRDRVLVAYFGDGTFAWCYPSKLKPFQKDFEQMSKQSNSNSFVNAVGEALQELGRCVESEMTCSCVPEEMRTAVTRSVTVNAGIKEGVTIPEGCIGELSITEFEPTTFLVRLREIAQAVTVIDLLEFTVIQCRLSAFFRVKGCRPLPAYHDPEDITDPEENAEQNLRFEETEFDGRRGDITNNPAEEDWLSSPGRERSLSEIRPEISEDKLYQRKKKSMAELMGERMDSELEADGSYVMDEGKVVGKPALPSRKQGKARHFSSLSVRIEDKDENSGDVAKEGKAVNKATSSSRKRKKSNDTFEAPSEAEGNKTFNSENDGAKEGTILSSPRIRKKSKYLSPPYTFLGGYSDMASLKDVGVESAEDPMSSQVGQSIHMEDDDADTEAKTWKIPQAGESGSRAVSRLTGSPPIIKFGGETFQKRAAKESHIGRKITGSLGLRTPKDNRKANVVEIMDKTSADKMLLEIRLAVLDCQYLKGARSSDAVVDFFTEFRRCMYSSGSDYESYKKYMESTVGRKRKSQLTGGSSSEKYSGMGDLSKASSGGRKKKTLLSEHGSLGKHTYEGDLSMEGADHRKTETQLIEHASSMKNPGGVGSVRRKPKAERTEHGSLESPAEADLSVAGSGGRKRKMQLAKNDSGIKNSGEAHLSLPDLGDRKSESRLTERDSLELNSGKGGLSVDASQRKRRKVKDETISEPPKKNLDHSTSGKVGRGGKVGRPRRATGSSGVRTDHKKANGESPAALLLTFAPGITLPSKDDLIKVFGKFGDLNESETEVLRDSGTARVVFARSSNAEEAFNSSERKSAFGSALVNCRLRYLQAASRALETNGSLHVPSLGGVGAIMAPSQAAAGPQLQFMQQNLEMMMSMLSESAQEDAGSAENLSPDVRANLAGEVNGLLKKVATLVKSSSQPPSS